ncbi:hypothetical protein L9F63_014522, partial [Diploptera punctata]
RACSKPVGTESAACMKSLLKRMFNSCMGYVVCYRKYVNDIACDFSGPNRKRCMIHECYSFNICCSNVC